MQAFLAERYVTGRERRQQATPAFIRAVRLLSGEGRLDRGGGDRGPMFKRWARLVGREDLLEDPRFQDDLSRGDQYELVGEMMTAWTSARTSAEAIAELEKARIPCGPAYSLEQNFVRSAGPGAGAVEVRTISGSGEGCAAGEYAGAAFQDAGRDSPSGAGLR